MTMSMIPDDQRLTSTSQYLAFNPLLFLARTLAYLSCIIGVALALFGNVAIGIFLLLSGAVTILSRNRQRARRYQIAGWYRIPRDIRLSEYLIWSDWRRFRLANLAFAALFPVLLLGIEGWLAWLAAMVGVALLTWPVPASILSLIKYHFDKDFRIVVFRRNQSEIAELHKSVIMPACGLFGQVLLITDESLSSYEEPMFHRMSTWWLSEMYHPMVVRDTPDHWHQIVMIELTYADFAVFDWSGEITKNMRWELEQALLVLPLERILLVGTSVAKIRNSVPDHLAEIAPQLHVTSTPQRGLQNVFFLDNLLDAMRALRPGMRFDQALARIDHFRAKIFLDEMDWKKIESGALDVSE